MIVFQIANQEEQFSLVSFEWKSVYVLTRRLAGAGLTQCKCNKGKYKAFLSSDEHCELIRSSLQLN